MKAIIFLILLIPILTFSQSPKKSNAIVIGTTQSESEALKTMGRLLIASDFVLETRNNFV